MNIKHNDNNNYWVRCKICNCRLSQGRVIDILCSYFIPVKTPRPILILDVNHILEPTIIFLCEEDRKWALDNKEAASAILGTRLS